MSAGRGYSSTLTAPKTVFQNQIVDNAQQGIGKLAAAALDALEMAANGPARKSHHDVLRSNTGWEMDSVAWANRSASSRLLTAQTERIASALVRGGIDVIREGDVTMISAVTGIVESLPVYRAVRFLPTIAARDRRPMVNGLKLFMAGHKNARFFRYAVMTCAKPVPAMGNLRGVIQELSRRISKWTNRIKKFGVKVLFRGIEFTRKTAEERGMADRYPADTILYHIHANVIYWPTRALKATAWEAFLRDTHDFIGAEWRDNGKVAKVEEIVKYCSKPNDTLAASEDELVWLYHETTKLKICQPLGDFKRWMCELNKRGEKVVRVHVGRGDGRLMRIRKMSRKDGADDADEAPDGPTEEQERPVVDVAEKADLKERSDPPANIVLGLSLPQWRHSPWAEPMIMIQHYNPLKLSDEADCDIREWQRQAREWWDEAFAPEPEEALRVARMAMDDSKSNEGIREAAEAAPYIHAYVVPTDDMEMRALRHHPGVTAKRAVMAAGTDGEDKKALSKRADVAYKAALRGWQDSYHEAVGIPCGLARLGPQRRSLTRAEWQAEKIQARALKATLDRAQAVKSKIETHIVTKKAETESMISAAAGLQAGAKAAQAEAARQLAAAKTAREAALKAQEKAVREQDKARSMMSRVRQEAVRVQAAAACLQRLPGVLRSVWDGFRKSTVEARLRRSLDSEMAGLRQKAAAADDRATAAHDGRRQAEVRARDLRETLAETGQQLAAARRELGFLRPPEPERAPGISTPALRRQG